MTRPTLLSRFVYSRVNYWCSLVGDTAMPTIFLAVGLFLLRSSAWHGGLGAIGALMTGWVFWSVLEYFLHRYVLHGTQTLARDGHAEHHRDELQLIASPLFIIPLVEVLMWILLWLWLGPMVAAFFVAGAAAGYASFSLLHHVFHHGGASGWPFRGLRRNHDVHHQLAGWNFGTTTSLWDRVLGTYRSPDTVPSLNRRTAQRRSSTIKS